MPAESFAAAAHVENSASENPFNDDGKVLNKTNLLATFTHSLGVSSKGSFETVHESLSKKLTAKYPSNMTGLPSVAYDCVHFWNADLNRDSKEVSKLVCKFSDLASLPINLDAKKLPLLKNIPRHRNVLRLYVLEGRDVTFPSGFLEIVRYSGRSWRQPSVHLRTYCRSKCELLKPLEKYRQQLRDVAVHSDESQYFWGYDFTFTQMHAVVTKDTKNLSCATLVGRVSGWNPDIVLIRITATCADWIKLLEHVLRTGKKVVILADSILQGVYDRLVETLAVLLASWNSNHRMDVTPESCAHRYFYDKYNSLCSNGDLTNLTWAFDPTVISIFKVNSSYMPSFDPVHEYLSLYSYVRQSYGASNVLRSLCTDSARLENVVFDATEANPIFSVTVTRHNRLSREQEVQVIGHVGELRVHETHVLGPDCLFFGAEEVYHKIVIDQIILVPSFTKRKVVKKNECALVRFTMKEDANSAGKLEMNNVSMRKMRISRKPISEELRRKHGYFYDINRQYR
ncbi:hypothetical protein V1512DRAFT_290450 [Lipomyces arxii]|uniref:uncharacterized protein n=1 Tax=Lipomyces arxii TaxID=56418 RepID=UPI0034CF31B8